MAVGVTSNAADDRGTTFNVLANRLVIDMKDDIAQLEPDAAPLTSMLMHPDLGTRQAVATKIEWLETELLPRLTTTNSDDNGSAGATSIVCASGTGAYFMVNDLLRMESTGEVMLVTAVSTDTLTVTRGVGVAAVDWGTTNGLTIARIGNASYQGQGLATMKETNVVANYNYTQIQRNPFGVTNSTAKAKMYGGNYLDVERKKKAIEHKQQIEAALFVGARDLKQTSSRPQGFCGGVTFFNTANITTVNGNLTATNLETYLRGIFRFGSGSKIGFCSPLFFSALSYFSTNKLALGTFAEASKQYGVSVKKYITGAGDELNLVLKRDWNDYPTASPGLGGSCVILDMSQVRFAEYRTTSLLQNRQAPDVDAQYDEWLTEYSLEVGLSGTHDAGTNSGNGVHGWIRGVTGYV